MLLKFNVFAQLCIVTFFFVKQITTEVENVEHFFIVNKIENIPHFANLPCSVI